jgi:hypothetical protein
VLDLMIILIFLIGLISRITMIIVPSEKSDESENPARSAMWFMKLQMAQMHTEMSSVILHVGGLCVA